MINAISLSFSRGNQQIYTDFSAYLDKGEAVLLTGPNGTGKSTLISLIGGLLQPQLGRIEIDGKDIAKLSSAAQAKLRSIAPQRRSFTLAFTVSELLHALPKKMRVADSSKFVAKLGLSDLLSKKVTELSIGQQERVSLALALNQEADYYLLDEPFSAQDLHSTQMILEIIDELRANKKGVLVISHNQDAISKYFDRVISLA